MKLRNWLVAVMMAVELTGLAQAATTLDGHKAIKVAQFTDDRACAYYLVNDPDEYLTPLGDLWILVKVTNNGRTQRIIVNPYDIEGSIKDAKLIGDNLYVINTSYRRGSNLACLDTTTGQWTNPIPDCNQCKFVGNNKIWVEYSHLVKEGECLLANEYRYTEATYTLK